MRNRYLVANFAGNGGRVMSYEDTGGASITLTELYANVGVGILSMAQEPNWSTLYVTLGPQKQIKKINLSTGVQVTLKQNNGIFIYICNIIYVCALYV